MPEERSRRTHAASSLGALLRRAQRRAERHAKPVRNSEEAAATPAETTVADLTSEESVARPRRASSSLVTDFLRPSRSQAIIAAVLFVTALLTAMGIKARHTDMDFSTMRRSDLIQILDTLNADARKLEAEINELERTKQNLSSGADAAKIAAEEARRRLNATRILAGTAPASGPGVRITISDPHNKIGPEHILDAVEELRDAGAEVMAINGSIRLVANTWFGRSSSGGLLISGEQVSFPLTIEAIGDPTTLEAGARFRGGLVSEIQNDRIGGVVTISQSDRLEIDAVAKPTVPQYSRPA